MHRRRSTALFIILVVLPIALLIWLGTYLMRDAAKRTEASMQATLADRISAADHQLVDDLRHLTDQLDSAAARAAGGDDLRQLIAQHPWVAKAWSVGAEDRVVEKDGPLPYEPFMKIDLLQEARAVQRISSEIGGLREAASQQTRGGPPFQRVVNAAAPRGPDSWQTFLTMPGYHLKDYLASSAESQMLSGWHVNEMSFIYWQRSVDGQVVCALLNRHFLMQALFPRLPHPGLEMPPGRMILATRHGLLHQWGRRLPGSELLPSSHRACSGPLAQWELAYTPAEEEFPKPYLFPILLGMGSGVLLVVAVGWLYFHESTQEITIAQQRVTFVNQISHELKTPLTNIRLYAEMAAHRAEAQADAAMQKQLAVITNESSRLDRLIQNVLSLARQQRDKLTISPKEIVLDEIVSRTVDFWRPQLVKRGFEVICELNGPPLMHADEDAVTQIVGNLISNVEKYAVTGLYIAIRSLVEGGKAKVVVEDRGPGIPASKRKSVFEPFERLRSDLTEGVSGTGIGLTIARELAQLHGGTLSVCPQYREGSRFILTLPLQPTQTPS